MPFPFTKTHTLHLQLAGEEPDTVDWMVMQHHGFSELRCAYTREMHARLMAGEDLAGEGWWSWQDPIRRHSSRHHDDQRGWAAPAIGEMPKNKAGVVIIVRHDQRSPAPSAAWARWGTTEEIWNERDLVERWRTWSSPGAYSFWDYGIACVKWREQETNYRERLARWKANPDRATGSEPVAYHARQPPWERPYKPGDFITYGDGGRSAPAKGPMPPPGFIWPKEPLRANGY